MKLKTGMVFATINGDSKGVKRTTYHEITRLYTLEDGRKMVEVSHFAPHMEDSTGDFFEREIQYMVRKGMMRLVNNWASRN